MHLGERPARARRRATRRSTRCSGLTAPPRAPYDPAVRSAPRAGRSRARGARRRGVAGAGPPVPGRLSQRACSRARTRPGSPERPTASSMSSGSGAARTRPRSGRPASAPTAATRCGADRARSVRRQLACADRRAGRRSARVLLRCERRTARGQPPFAAAPAAASGRSPRLRSRRRPAPPCRPRRRRGARRHARRRLGRRRQVRYPVRRRPGELRRRRSASGGCCASGAQPAVDQVTGQAYVAWASSAAGCDRDLRRGRRPRAARAGPRSSPRAPRTKKRNAAVLPDGRVALDGARRGARRLPRLHVGVSQGRAIDVLQAGARKLVLQDQGPRRRPRRACRRRRRAGSGSPGLAAGRSSPRGRTATPHGSGRSARSRSGAAPRSSTSSQGDGSTGPLDLVANLRTRRRRVDLWHQQVLPGLSLGITATTSRPAADAVRVPRHGRGRARRRTRPSRSASRR